MTIGFLVLSLVGHRLFGSFLFVNERQAHGEPVEAAPFVIEVLHQTFENWQSEFLQVLWQAAGLTLLFFIGSPQSKDSEDRSERMQGEAAVLGP